MAARDGVTVGLVHEYGIAVVHQGAKSIEVPVEEIGRLVGELQSAEERIAGGGTT